MNGTSFLIEAAATAVESFVAVCAVVRIVNDDPDRKKEGKVIFFGAALLVIFVSLLNLISLISLFTTIAAIVFVAAWAKIALHGKPSLCLLATIFVYFTIHSMDYLTLSICEFAACPPALGQLRVSPFVNPGIERVWYLSIDKGIDVLLYLALRSSLPKLQRLPDKQIHRLLAFSCTVYSIMSICFFMMLSNSPFTLRTSMLLVWLLLVALAFITIGAFWTMNNYRKEREANRLLQISSSLLEENYKNLHATQKQTAKRTHDFNHHLNVLHELSVKGKSREAARYIEALLTASSEEAALYHSGNDIIDAVINSKLAEAKTLRIDFDCKANFSIPTNIKSIDLCAILANQLENAFDACKQIPEGAPRQISVHIWQKAENMAMFQVSNTVLRDPFAGNPDLASTKTDSSRSHGLGIKNIQETAEKYNGTLENKYQNGKFTSTVLLCYTPALGRSQDYT